MSFKIGGSNIYQLALVYYHKSSFVLFERQLVFIGDHFDMNVQVSNVPNTV